MKYYFLFKIFKILIGLVLIIWGGLMVIQGIEGKIDWLLKIFGNESTLLNATPGVLLIVVGFLIIILERAKVEYTEDK